MLLAIPVQGSADALTVSAKGRIDPACSISVQTPFPAADFANAGSAPGSAVLDCNTGFVLKATSANGAVTSTSAVSTGFTNSLNYKLRLILTLGDTVLTAVCNSRALVAGNSSCALSPAGAGLASGGKPAFHRTAALQLAWTPPIQPRLVAGSYHDTLTITVAAAP